MWLRRNKAAVIGLLLNMPLAKLRQSLLVHMAQAYRQDESGSRWFQACQLLRQRSLQCSTRAPKACCCCHNCPYKTLQGLCGQYERVQLHGINRRTPDPTHHTRYTPHACSAPLLLLGL